MRDEGACQLSNLSTWLDTYLLWFISLRTPEKNQDVGEIIGTVFNLLNLSHLYDLFSLRWYRWPWILIWLKVAGFFYSFNHTSTTLSFSFSSSMYLFFWLSWFWVSWVKPLCLCFPSGQEGSVTVANCWHECWCKSFLLSHLRYTGVKTANSRIPNLDIYTYIYIYIFFFHLTKWT